MGRKPTNQHIKMKTILATLLFVACASAIPGGYYRKRYRPAPPLGDVVDVAVGAGSFKTLVSIVSDLGLVDTLKGDEAFAKIDPEVLNSLTAEQKKTIVLRHVVTAKVPAAAVTTGPVETIGGESIDLVKTAEGGVQVNFNGGTSNVVAADVMASNGVIHVIDKVIL